MPDRSKKYLPSVLISTSVIESVVDCTDHAPVLARAPAVDGAPGAAPVRARGRHGQAGGQRGAVDLKKGRKGLRSPEV